MLNRHIEYYVNRYAMCAMHVSYARLLSDKLLKK